MDVFKFTEDQQTALKLIGGDGSEPAPVRRVALGQDFDPALLHCAAGAESAGQPPCGVPFPQNPCQGGGIDGLVPETDEVVFSGDTI